MRSDKPGCRGENADQPPAVNFVLWDRHGGAWQCVPVMRMIARAAEAQSLRMMCMSTINAGDKMQCRGCSGRSHNLWLEGDVSPDSVDQVVMHRGARGLCCLTCCGHGTSSVPSVSAWRRVADACLMCTQPSLCACQHGESGATGQAVAPHQDLRIRDVAYTYEQACSRRTSPLHPPRMPAAGSQPRMTC